MNYADFYFIEAILKLDNVVTGGFPAVIRVEE